MIILTLGTFDLLHAGHLELIQAMRKLGEVCVGLNSDEFVEEYKGSPPRQQYWKRKMNLEKIARVYVRENDGPGKKLIMGINPDYVAVGMDWATGAYFQQIDMSPAQFEQNNIGLLFIPRTTGVSTTRLKEQQG